MSLLVGARHRRAGMVAAVLAGASAFLALLPTIAPADLSQMLGKRARANAVAIQPDGKIVTVGRTLADDSVSYLLSNLAVTRVLADGSPDPDFGTAGVVVMNFASDLYGAINVAIDSDGKIVVVGSMGANSVLRMLPDGTLDPDFGVDGIAQSGIGDAGAVAIQTDGRIVVGGSGYVARYLSDGSLDATFGTAGLAADPPMDTDWEVHDLAIQPDGKILAAAGSISVFTVGRLNTDGTFDTSFDGDGIATIAPIASDRSHATGVAVQTDGKILVSGATRLYPYPYQAMLARFETDGSPDAAFGTNGNVQVTLGSSSDWVPRLFTMALQSDGKAVVIGTCVYDFGLVRFTTAGALDTTFGTAGTAWPDLGGQVWYSQNGGCDVAVQPDGGIIAAGFADHGANQSTALVRFTSDGELDSTFEDDGIVVESDCRRFPLSPSTCLVASKSDLRFSVSPYSSTTDRRRLQWKWKSGPAFDQASLGTPGTDTRYTLCIYDTVSSVPRLATWLDVYGQAPKWSEQPHGGWSYRNTREPWRTDGVSQLRVKSGAVTRAMLRGSYNLLPLPTAVSTSSWFVQDPDVIVRLINSDGFCLTSEFPVTSTKVDDGAEFSATIKAP